MEKEYWREGGFSTVTKPPLMIWRAGKAPFLFVLSGTWMRFACVGRVQDAIDNLNTHHALQQSPRNF